MDEDRFQALMNRYLSGSLSAKELEDLIAYLQTDESESLAKQAIQQELSANLDTPAIGNAADLLFQKILHQAVQSKKTNPSFNDQPDHFIETRRRNYFRPFAAAAVLILFLSGSYIFFVHRQPTKNIVRATPVSRPAVADILPGSDKATLTLADGSTVILNKSAKGTIAKQGSSVVQQLADGALAYKASQTNAVPVVYNTIATPRGGQYQLTLADGTKVWLNALSSLRFPTAFNGSERNVVLTGEAYFEVEKDAAKPFHVFAGNMQVEVRGTHFNVNAYADERTVKTTLLEGAVKILQGKAAALLQPGQQSVVNNAASAIQVKEVDAEEAVAWKNGYFQFNGNDVQTIMRQVERWYDVNVGYEGKIPGWHFTGAIQRNIPLAQLLHMLEVNDVHFKIDGKTITVLQ